MSDERPNSDTGPVTPTMTFFRDSHAAMLSRILCPAWRWSNVPPSATTGREGLTLSASGGRDVYGALQDAGLEMNTGLDDLEIHHENVSDSAVRNVASTRFTLQKRSATYHPRTRTMHPLS